LEVITVANLLIIGADHLGNITKKLKNCGVSNVIHVSGRKVNMVRMNIPENVDFILVITDFVNHNLAKVIKQKAKDQEIPTYYVKRSWSSIYKVLQEQEVLQAVS
jgi:hypothetical protein